MLIWVTTLLIVNSFSVEANGLKSIYTLPCGPNNYTIIPVVDYYARGPYTLYAANGTTVIAGPQAGNVFTGVPGNDGDNLVIAVKNIFDNNPLFTTITLSGGTGLINGQIQCVCAIRSTQDDFCAATPGVDSITGATYLWTSPTGIHYYQSGFIAAEQPPENGIWTVTATLVTGGCTHILSNSFTLVKCGEPITPVLYNYVRSGSSDCKIKTEWSTTSEQNTDRFEIEMSETGNSGWHEVSMVSAAGFSSSSHAYSTSFDAGNIPVVFIRLKEIERDGRFNYSTVFKVNNSCKTTGNKLSVFPVIAQPNSSITLRFESNTEKGRSGIIITDAAGRQILNQPITIHTSINQYIVSLAHFTQGTYFVKLAAGNTNWQSNTVKFIVP